MVTVMPSLSTEATSTIARPTKCTSRTAALIATWLTSAVRPAVQSGPIITTSTTRSTIMMEDLLFGRIDLLF